MSERLKIGNSTVTVQKLRKPLWPDAHWKCFRGSLEATGSTRENAIYNFKRVDHQRPGNDDGQG